MGRRTIPFVTLTFPRTGSAWLIDALDSHPDVVAYGELLRRGSDGELGYGSDDIPCFPEYLAARRAGARGESVRRLVYLNTVFRDRPGVGAAGFKLMYGQVRGSRGILQYLALRRVRVVHLVRANLLDAVISYEVAKSTGVFHPHRGESVPLRAVSLDASGLRERLEHMEWSVARARSWLERYRLPRIDIAYEELVGRGEDTFSRILRFLRRGPDVQAPRLVSRAHDHAILNGAGRERRRRARSAHRHAVRVDARRAAMTRPGTIWLVLPDPFPTRVFVDCGIVAGLEERFPGVVEAVLVLPRDEALAWAPRLGDVPWTIGGEFFPTEVGTAERMSRRIDLALDRNVGYYPLSVRHSLRHGFNRERMRPGHSNLFLDSSLTGRLPESERLDGLVRAWLFSKRRYVSKTLLARMRESCSCLVVANVQSQPAVPFLLAARRLEIPVVGYVASWDHTVGKGIVSPYVTRYVVQNDVMRDDLVRYHGIAGERVTGNGLAADGRLPCQAAARLVRGRRP